MTGKRTLIETIVFCCAWIVLFLASFLTIFLTAKSRTNNDLESTIKVVENIFNPEDIETSGQETVDAFIGSDTRVSIIEAEPNGYTILFDSQDLLASDGTAPEIEPRNLGTCITRTSSYGYNMIYLAERDGDYYVRVAVKESEAVAISRNFLIYGSVVVIIVTGFFVLYKYRDYKMRVKPLRDQLQRLMYLSHLDPASVEGTTDLNMFAKSIDSVSSSINQIISDLETEKKKLRMILDSTPLSLIAISGDEKITFMNKEASKLFEYKEADVLDKDYHVLFVDENFSQKVSKVIFHEEEVNPFKVQFRGRYYQVSIINLPYSWNANSPSGVIIYLVDVTEERNASQMKADFFANASHELKTPLTSILGYLELVSNDFISDPEEQKKAINKAIKEAKRMRDLLADMLTINQLESVEKKPREDIDIQEIINNYFEILAPKIQNKNLTVKKEIERVIINANRSDMEQLFGNLLDNAVKYNKDNGTIDISLTEKRFIIKDTGIGIKQENLPHIFERFYRVNNSKIKSNIEGTGLGLAIVKHICQAYGFTVDVSSTFGQGTQFTVELKK